MRIAAIVTVVSLFLMGVALAQQPPPDTPMKPSDLPQQKALQRRMQQDQGDMQQRQQQIEQRRQHPRPGQVVPGKNPLAQRQEVEGPCKRSAQQITISGVDQDADSCFEANLGDVIDNLGLQLTGQLKKEAGISAKYTLMEQDKDAVQARLDDANKLLGWYRDYYDSVEPVLAKLLDKQEAP
jgi:hypothetical protein